ncbi:hypothetical protein ILUMI_12804 [Ignelater luminosus]|uniref:Uncharacterized protein n=1 Tax=Ignelater luminosus TaxID=2038154 RepID=A0A8K0G6F5_IGNLU|nr:hypothetical protein ILUMI_12804 [Ignelater luminosus]
MWNGTDGKEFGKKRRTVSQRSSLILSEKEERLDAEMSKPCMKEVKVIKTSKKMERYNVGILGLCEMKWLSNNLRNGTSWENKRPLTSAELLLEENDDLVEADSIDAVYIPLPVDKVTDEEDIDDDGQIDCESALVDVSGTYKIHAKVPDDSTRPVEKLPGPSKSKKTKYSTNNFAKKQLDKVSPTWKKEDPVYTKLPQDCEQIKVKEISNQIEGNLRKLLISLSGENWYDDADIKWLIPVLNQEVDHQDDSDEDGNQELNCDCAEEEDNFC